jgi:hypothetical protein
MKKAKWQLPYNLVLLLKTCALLSLLIMQPSGRLSRQNSHATSAVSLPRPSTSMAIPAVPGRAEEAVNAASSASTTPVADILPYLAPAKPYMLPVSLFLVLFLLVPPLRHNIVLDSSC